MILGFKVTNSETAGDEDRSLFLDTLGEACAKTGWRAHAFVGDHDHLLVKTPEPNLSVVRMRRLLDELKL